MTCAISGVILSATKRTAAFVADNRLDNLFAGGRMLCDGAMGTILLDRGISMNRCYDELNLLQPATIAAIHSEYLHAGAEIIETNTFGGNAFRLERHGLRGKVREINLAGVRIARQCVAQIGKELGTNAYVAGAIGPLGILFEPRDQSQLDKARSAFAEQVRALAEGGHGVGVDLLMIETMTSLVEASEAIGAARQVAPRLRLVVMMTVGKDGNCLDGSSAEAAAARLTDLGADAVGCNCSTGPASVLRALGRMRTATHLPLAAMPNAGLPNVVDGRADYFVSPTEMASCARSLLQAGASLVGGCCGTTPAHTQAMTSAMRNR